MTSLSTVTSRQGHSLHWPAGRGHRIQIDRHRAIALALYLAVLVATAIAVAVAAPRIPDIGSLYIAVT